ncbi:hypothetical protein Tco_1148555 [Tanacetum coccineum]
MESGNKLRFGKYGLRMRWRLLGVVVVELELMEWRSSERVSSDGDGSIDGGEVNVLSKEDLKGTRIEHGFKRAFLSATKATRISRRLIHGSLLGDQLVSQFTLDYDSLMTNKYFAEHTRIEVKQFRETLLQHMINVKKSVAKRTRHKRLYDIRVNKRQMQTQESKVDSGKALDAGLVVTESSGTEYEKQDTSSRSGNNTDAHDADTDPYMTKSQ